MAAHTSHPMADSIRVSLPTSEEHDELEMGEALSSPGEAQQHQHRPQKRRRIPIACGACRSKKSRCDGYRPKCSSCSTQNIECIYLAPPISATTPVPRAFLQLVESRLAQLESDVRFLRDQQSPAASEMSDPIFGSRRGSIATYMMGERRESLSANQLSSDRRESLSAYSLPGMPLPEPEPAPAPEEDEDFGVLPDATDGIGSIEFTHEEDSGYYGPSSNIAFTRNIRRALYALLSRPPVAARQQQQQQKQKQQRQQAADGGAAVQYQLRDVAVDVAHHRPSLDVSRPVTPQPRAPFRSHGVGGPTVPNKYYANSQEHLQFPPDGEMNALVSRFFADTGALFPFVHGPSFMETYALVTRSGFRKARRSWLGLLNAILAMATVTSASWSVTAADRAAKAEVFYMRAKALCLEQMLHNASLETVQAVLLMSQYLQGTHRSTTTWSIHGLAVKAAFQLGLHMTSSSAKYSALDREVRLRTWYGCIMLDRTLSMTFGRPPAIPESYIRTPLPKKVETASTEQRIEVTSLSTDFFVHTITLYRILWTVIDVLYDCNIGTPAASVLPVASSILQIEHHLLEWQANLGPNSRLVTPDELRIGGAFTMERRFRVILTLRYHNVRILAHRRMLDLCLASMEHGRSYDAQDSMLKQVGQRSKGICCQSASDLIAIVHILEHSPDSKRGLLGAWWFTLYYTFNATLTIVALVLCCHVAGEESSAPYEVTNGMSRRALQDSLSHALACLPLIDKGNRMVDKCAGFAATLSHCLQLLDQSSSHFGGDRPTGDGAGAALGVETPRGGHMQYGVPQTTYAPIPIDTSHFDLGNMGWDTDFLATLGGQNSGEGFQEADLFC